MGAPNLSFQAAWPTVSHGTQLSPKGAGPETPDHTQGGPCTGQLVPISDWGPWLNGAKRSPHQALLSGDNHPSSFTASSLFLKPSRLLVRVMYLWDSFMEWKMDGWMEGPLIPGPSLPSAQPEHLNLYSPGQGLPGAKLPAQPGLPHICWAPEPPPGDRLRGRKQAGRAAFPLPLPSAPEQRRGGRDIRTMHSGRGNDSREPRLAKTWGHPATIFTNRTRGRLVARWGASSASPGQMWSPHS